MAVDFSYIQDEFTRYIRNPGVNPAPKDVKPERMAMYRELIFNNINGFLEGNFPVIRKILDDQQWLDLVQDFFVRHQSKTPYFAEIAEEFLTYLENERESKDDFPFLLELAHYEWVEMALSIAIDDVKPNQQKDNQALVDSALQLSSLAWLLIYQYPVQRISTEFLPLEAPQQPTCLIVYREVSDEVKFVEINSITYRLLEIIQESGGIQAKACLDQVALESQHPNPDIIVSGGLEIIKEMVEKNIILLR